MTTRQRRNRSALLLFAAGIVLTAGGALPGAAQTAGAGPAAERWFLVRIGGQDVGYVRESTTRGKDGPDAVVQYASEMKIVLNRLGARVEMAVVSGAEESGSGLLRRLGFDLKASALTMRTEVEVKDGALEIKTGAAGKPFTRTLPFSGELLGPEGIRLRSIAGLRAPGDTVAYATFEPSMGKVVKAVRVLVGRETLDLEGGAVSALKVEETNDAQPVKRTFWLGEDGEVLRDEEPGPFGLTEIVRVDKARALASSAGGELPAEAFEQTLLKARVRLPRPRDIEYLKVRLVHRRPELGWPEIPGALQKVAARTDSTLEIEVRRAGRARPAALGLPATPEGRAYLEPNAYLQSDDPALRAQAEEIVGAERDAWRAALKLRRWVSDRMTFDLGIAFAPSVEIFKNRRGTCVGYATILAALARAAGIPSRFVMGYAYALGMFGGHAWTEVLVGGDWIPLDAALPGEGAADAARFHLAESTLADGAGSMLGSAQQVMGSIDLEVLAYRVAGGKTVDVPIGAKPYLVEGDAYRNPWLGLAVRKPAGFSFGRLDAVWPSTLLVEMKGPDGGRLELHEVPVEPWDEPAEAARGAMAKLGVGGALRAEQAGGRAAWAASGADAAAVAIPEPGVVWVLKAEGKAALAAVEVAVRTLRFDGD